MPGSEYTTPSSGALKLKGGSGVDKKRKKKKPKPAEDATSADGAKRDIQAMLADEDEKRYDGAKVKDDGEEAELSEQLRKDLVEHRGKTEAERRHEEMRRRRLDERLKREGIKTHKERVEELNRYLSNLSEHHDMPRIGPG